MGTFVSAYTDRRTAFGFGRGGTVGGKGFREVGAAVPAVGGETLGQGRRETFSRVYDRFDGSRVGRLPAGSGMTAPTGRRIDITV